MGRETVQRFQGVLSANGTGHMDEGRFASVVSNDRGDIATKVRALGDADDVLLNDEVSALASMSEQMSGVATLMDSAVPCRRRPRGQVVHLLALR